MRTALQAKSRGGNKKKVASLQRQQLSGTGVGFLSFDEILHCIHYTVFGDPYDLNA